MYTWDFNDPLVRSVFDSLPAVAQRGMRELMDAMVLVDPMEFRRRPGEGPGNLRTLHFGEGDAGLVAVHIVEFRDQALVVQIGWSA